MGVNMKTLLKLIVVPFFFILISVLHAEEDRTVDLGKKFYVQNSQIDCVADKIYINANGYIYEVPMLHVDEQGIYITRIKAKSGNCHWYEWQCTGCNYCNFRGVDWVCRSCGKSISG